LTNLKISRGNRNLAFREIDGRRTGAPVSPNAAAPVDCRAKLLLSNRNL
jgi:hypothetical protein